MTFPDAFKAHVIPRIRRMITHQAARVHEGEATFGEAHARSMTPRAWLTLSRVFYWLGWTRAGNRATDRYHGSGRR